MTDFLDYCNQLSPLCAETEEQLLLGSELKTFAKGSYVLKSGKICRHLIYVKTGLVKLSFVNNNNNKEFITHFYPENMCFTAFDSYLSQTPSQCDIIALENSNLVLVEADLIEDLCKKHHCVETLLRKIISNVSLQMTLRLKNMLALNASEAYQEFIKENGNLLQRISLGDLANYLGINQASLSRIRNQK